MHRSMATKVLVSIFANFRRNEKLLKLSMNEGSAVTVGL